MFEIKGKIFKIQSTRDTKLKFGSPIIQFFIPHLIFESKHSNTSHATCLIENQRQQFQATYVSQIMRAMIHP